MKDGRFDHFLKHTDVFEIDEIEKELTPSLCKSIFELARFLDNEEVGGEFGEISLEDTGIEKMKDSWILMRRADSSGSWTTSGTACTGNHLQAVFSFVRQGRGCKVQITSIGN